MTEPMMVTVTYTRGDKVITRVVGSAGADGVAWEAKPGQDVVLSEDARGTILWYGFELRNATRFVERKP